MFYGHGQCENVQMYESQTWVLKENSIQKLMIFERKILRKIFGPKKKRTVCGELKPMKNWMN